MLIQATQLHHSQIVADEGETLLGKVQQPIFDPQLGILVGFVVQKPGWLTKPGLLSAVDVIECEPGLLTVRTADSIIEGDELPRLVDLLQEKISILGQRAETEAGKFLGRVDDLLLDTLTWQITKYYLRGLVNQQIIPSRFVSRITRQAVIFSSQIDEPPKGIAGETETAAA
ncbi:hypothetical protein HY523_00310 [Candidatus Berkelbacteria bacterium]|nr:hypothetical protein [Candidatus Berkelbacteria bacterium]